MVNGGEDVSGGVKEDRKTWSQWDTGWREAIEDRGKMGAKTVKEEAFKVGRLQHRVLEYGGTYTRLIRFELVKDGKYNYNNANDNMNEDMETNEIKEKRRLSRQ